MKVLAAQSADAHVQKETAHEMRNRPSRVKNCPQESVSGTYRKSRLSHCWCDSIDTDSSFIVRAPLRGYAVFKSPEGRNSKAISIVSEIYRTSSDMKCHRYTTCCPSWIHLPMLQWGCTSTFTIMFTGMNLVREFSLDVGTCPYTHSKTLIFNLHTSLLRQPFKYQQLSVPSLFINRNLA